MRRKCSRRVPERMTERVAGIGARDAEDEQAFVSAVSYDDPRIAVGAIPFERDRVTVVLACVELHEHDWLLSGFGHLISAGLVPLAAEQGEQKQEDVEDVEEDAGGDRDRAVGTRSAQAV